MRNKKLGLIFFDPYSENKGTAALAYSIIYLLEDLAMRKQVKFDYIFLEPGRPKRDLSSYELEVGDKKIKIKQCMCFPSHTLRAKAYRLAFFKEYPASMDIDYALDIGEGDSYADIYGKARFDTFDAVKRIYLRHRIPYAILPQTLGPFNDKKVEARAKKTLSKCKFIIARDVKSQKYIEKLLGRNDIGLTPDIAFYLPYKKRPFDNGKINVGLNISGLLWYGGYTMDNQFSLNCDYKRLISRLIEYFSGMGNVVLHLIPHVCGAFPTVDNDWPVSYKLYKKYNAENIVLSPFFMSPCDAKSYIAGMDFFAGARLHATIGAFSSNVPVSPMAYSRKFTGLYEDTFKYNHVANLMTMTDDEAFNIVKASFEKRLELKKETEIVMKEVMEKKLYIEDQIAQFINIKSAGGGTIV